MKIRRLFWGLLVLFLFTLIIKPASSSAKTYKDIDLGEIFVNVKHPSHTKGMESTIIDDFDEAFKNTTITKITSFNGFKGIELVVPKRLNYANNAENIYQKHMIAYLNEHKEFFMLDNNVFRVVLINQKIRFELKVYEHYHHLANLIEDYNLYNQEINNIMRKINAINTVESTIRFVHDYLIMNNEYNQAALVDHPSKKDMLAHSPISALLSKYSPVCEGYAELFTLILNISEIPNVYVYGPLYDQNGQETSYHAWNLVKLSDKWYQVDVTHDDPVYDGVHYYNRVHYNYFLTPFNHKAKKPRALDQNEMNNDIIAYANSAKSYFYPFQVNADSGVGINAKSSPKNYLANDDLLFFNTYYFLDFKNANFYLYQRNTNTLICTNELANHLYRTKFNHNTIYYYIARLSKATDYIENPFHFFEYKNTLNILDKVYLDGSNTYTALNEDINHNPLDLKTYKLTYDDEQTFNEATKNINKDIAGYKFVGFAYRHNTGMSYLLDPNKALKELNLNPENNIYFIYKKADTSENNEDNNEADPSNVNKDLEALINEDKKIPTTAQFTLIHNGKIILEQNYLSFYHTYNFTIIKRIQNLPGLIAKLVYLDSDGNEQELTTKNNIVPGKIIVRSYNYNYNIPKNILKKYKIEFNSNNEINIYSPTGYIYKSDLKEQLKGYNVRIIGKELEITNTYGLINKIKYNVIKGDYLIPTERLKVGQIAIGLVILAVITTAIVVPIIILKKRKQDNQIKPFR